MENNLKPHKTSVTPKKIKKAITSLVRQRRLVLIVDCVPVVVLKNYGPKISHMPTELFNKCLRKSC